MKIFTLEEENEEYHKWVAIVGHGKDVAFYEVADDYNELIENVKDKSNTHFPGLLETSKAWVKVVKSSLSEINIPEYWINRALQKLPARAALGKRIPPEIAVPLELELAPIVSFGATEREVANLEVLRKRNLICRTEVCTLAKCNPSDPIFVERSGKPLWKIVPREECEKARYLHAKISGP